MVDENGYNVGEIPRYGVWAWDHAKRRHQVVATGNELEALRREFGDLEVVAIGGP